jgi:hypothetical protein
MLYVIRVEVPAMMSFFHEMLLKSTPRCRSSDYVVHSRSEDVSL